MDVLRAYCDGEMSAQEQEHLQAHLARCPPCVDFLNTYKDTPELCRKALVRKMPGELFDQLKAFLRSKA